MHYVTISVLVLSNDDFFGLVNSMDTTMTNQITAELRTLLLLTNTEVQIATARQAQARTDAVRRELAQNADNGVSRARAIEATLRELGGVPDVVSPLLGRVSALVKTMVEQAEPLPQALLEDLAMEHQLADRSRYLKALATAADSPRVTRLAERLITAHDATVEWLTTVLAEDALGGPTALRATPLQAVTRVAARVAGTPARAAAEGINQAVSAVRGARGGVQEAAEEVATRGARVAEDITETVTAGRDASLAKREEVAVREGKTNRAKTVRRARTRVGGLKASELPIAAYPTKNIADAVAAIKALSTSEDLQAVLGFEEAHKNRRGVVSATQAHLATIAKDVVGIPTTNTSKTGAASTS